MKSEKTNKLEHELVKCMTACETCATLCLQEDDVKKMARCIMVLRDCSDICMLTAKFVGRSSEHAKHVMKECIEICRICAEETGKFETDHCQHCSAICKECVEACETWMQTK
ncbi:hypothetical protein CLV24_10221 [Pontibacter ummariensis]|uniref:Four-helix bundle copper-binding protein n=1 Tax=Pontibacter ummariensis TaxID=1610492 RepID=A0A239C980_9BACT|nr:four-helix bundle copper-binding protein [Pontibacter ummariensis]PRY15400.1 hypothetical protein CLV24_10221 [Pontibacter ummariensis]SNS16218.1 hypothetical protein SAMN06296052_102392 [Pontibacter ummariensis]